MSTVDLRFLLSERAIARTAFGCAIAAVIAMGIPQVSWGQPAWLTLPLVLGVLAVLLEFSAAARLLDVGQVYSRPATVLLAAVLVSAVASQLQGGMGVRWAEVTSELAMGFAVYLSLVASTHSFARLRIVIRAVAIMTAVATCMILVAQSLVWLAIFKDHESRYWRFQWWDLPWLSSIGLCLAAYCYQQFGSRERPAWGLALAANAVGLTLHGSPWGALAVLGAVTTLVGLTGVRLRWSAMTGVVALVFGPLLMGSSGFTTWPVPVTLAEAISQMVTGMEHVTSKQLVFGVGQAFTPATDGSFRSAYVSNYLQLGIVGGSAALGCLLIAGFQALAWCRTPPRSELLAMERWRHYMTAMVVVWTIAWLGSPQGALSLLFVMAALLTVTVQVIEREALCDEPPVRWNEEMVALFAMANGGLLVVLFLLVRWVSPASF